MNVTGESHFSRPETTIRSNEYYQDGVFGWLKSLFRKWSQVDLQYYGNLEFARRMRNFELSSNTSSSCPHYPRLKDVFFPEAIILVNFYEEEKAMNWSFAVAVTQQEYKSFHILSAIATLSVNAVLLLENLSILEFNTRRVYQLNRSKTTPSTCTLNLQFSSVKRPDRSRDHLRIQYSLTSSQPNWKTSMMCNAINYRPTFLSTNASTADVTRFGSYETASKVYGIDLCKFGSETAVSSTDKETHPSNLGSRFTISDGNIYFVPYTVPSFRNVSFSRAGKSELLYKDEGCLRIGWFHRLADNLRNETIKVRWKACNQCFDGEANASVAKVGSNKPEWKARDAHSNKCIDVNRIGCTGDQTSGDIYKTVDGGYLDKTDQIDSATPDKISGFYICVLMNTGQIKRILLEELIP
ncbi:hypothetical protein CLF_105650 [Clonorchis sinensis]|uniref:Uncharacterized protein n=1 Tax=Clonorchis sinensis TaxID=79923 RepID=G7YDW6_CLOSI|nr:hypothetical protein CLF_105650 [Clonorchis sinensis]